MPTPPAEVARRLEGPVNSIFTSFTRDGEVDWEGVRRQIEIGIGGVVLARRGFGSAGGRGAPVDPDPDLPLPFIRAGHDAEPSGYPAVVTGGGLSQERQNRLLDLTGIMLQAGISLATIKLEAIGLFLLLTSPTAT